MSCTLAFSQNCSDVVQENSLYIYARQGYYKQYALPWLQLALEYQRL